MSIGRISIEPTLENATTYGGIIPLLDYFEKIQLTNHLEEYLTVSKQGGKFPLASDATTLILGRLLGMERISHFENTENEILLKRILDGQNFRILRPIIMTYNDLKMWRI